MLNVKHTAVIDCCQASLRDGIGGGVVLYGESKCEETQYGYTDLRLLTGIEPSLVKMN